MGGGARRREAEEEAERKGKKKRDVRKNDLGSEETRLERSVLTRRSFSVVVLCHVNRKSN